MTSGSTNQLKPVVVLAFANEQEGKRYLRELPGEARELRAALQKAEDRGLCELDVRTNVTFREVVEVFNRHGRRVAIFHYGGHAGPDCLLLESSTGAVRVVHAGGLARFLGLQGGLQLLFLNGCSTGPQVADLLAAGVDAVVATARPIDDQMAAQVRRGLLHPAHHRTDLPRCFHAGRGAGEDGSRQDSTRLHRGRDPVLHRGHHRRPRLSLEAARARRGGGRRAGEPAEARPEALARAAPLATGTVAAAESVSSPPAIHERGGPRLLRPGTGDRRPVRARHLAHRAAGDPLFGRDRRRQVVGPRCRRAAPASGDSRGRLPPTRRRGRPTQDALRRTEASGRRVGSGPRPRLPLARPRDAGTAPGGGPRPGRGGVHPPPARDVAGR